MNSDHPTVAGESLVDDATSASPETLHPTAPENRFVLLDVVRGVAVLGILAMNISAFALPMAAYQNPNAMGELQGSEYTAWWLTEVFANTKFITLFSMLFGAGIVLMSERASSRGRSAFAVHLRRMAGLLLIGLIHAYAFWYGDILFTYAVCGTLCFAARNLSSRWLVIFGATLLVIGWMILSALGLLMTLAPAETIAQTEAEFAPSSESLQREIDAYRGGFLDQMAYRAPASLMMQFVLLPMQTLWRVCGTMLIGMAMYKSRFLVGGWRPTFYPLIALGGIATGIAGALLGIALNRWNENDAMFAMFFGDLPTDISSIPMAMGYVALLQWILLTPARAGIAGTLSPVGRLALTNYLGQTVICTTLFYGHGLGLFGTLNRVQMWYVVLLIWLFQIAFSIAWVTFFRQGPMESLWRKMTYAGGAGGTGGSGSVGMKT